MESHLDNDGNVVKCKDQYKLDTEGVLGDKCNSYVPDAGAVNPALRYSIKATTGGKAHSFRNTYISYPANQIMDDALEFCFGAVPIGNPTVLVSRSVVSQ